MQSHLYHITYQYPRGWLRPAETATKSYSRRVAERVAKTVTMYT